MISPKKHKINSNNIPIRLQFAQEVDTWFDEDFAKIVFTDESKLFSQQCSRPFIRVLKGRRIPRKYYRLSQQFHGGLEIFVWGAITSDGGAKLVRLEGKFNSQEYLKIMESEVMKIEGISNGEKIFQKDGSDVHRANIITNYIEYNNIDNIDWLAQSPDLSLIENVWAYVKNFFFLKRILTSIQKTMYFDMLKRLSSVKNAKHQYNTCIQNIDQKSKKYQKKKEKTQEIIDN
ncbi:hypothetical protein ABPG72_018821 [Tetrahymena utriculariae]